jgi:hypothetical protein
VSCARSPSDRFDSDARTGAALDLGVLVFGSQRRAEEREALMLTRQEAENLAAGRATAAHKNGRKDIRRFFRSRPFLPTQSSHRIRSRDALVTGYGEAAVRLAEAVALETHRLCRRLARKNDGKVPRGIAVDVVDPLTGTELEFTSTLPRRKKR